MAVAWAKQALNKPRRTPYNPRPRQNVALSVGHLTPPSSSQTSSKTEAPLPTSHQRSKTNTYCFYVYMKVTLARPEIRNQLFTH